MTTTGCPHCHAEEPDHQPSDCPMKPARAIVYVNAYSVGRCYGGPEEGGWWYDAGEPIPGASIPIYEDEDPEPFVDRLTKLLGWAKYPSQGRYSMIGGADFEVYVEDHPARPFPEETPHYE